MPDPRPASPARRPAAGDLPLPPGVPADAVRADPPVVRPGRGTLTSTRSKARRAALDLLYEAEARGIPAADLLAQRLERPTTQVPLRDYTAEIVRGVVEHGAAIDDALATYSRGWRLDRMPAVDRAALRVGVYEILYNDDVPDAVAVSEAVALVAELSTDESPTFVSGLLSRIVEVKVTLL